VGGDEKGKVGNEKKETLALGRMMGGPEGAKKERSKEKNTQPSRNQKL